MSQRHFSLAELLLWVAFVAANIACLQSYFRDFFPKRSITSVDSIVIAADGSTAAAATRDGSVRIWDLKRRTPLRTIQTASSSEEMTLSNDGALLAIFEPFYGNRGRGDRIEVWDVRAGKRQRGRFGAEDARSAVHAPQHHFATPCWRFGHPVARHGFVPDWRMF